jgi:nicotinate-nucleotide adenylyltransferase
MPVWYLVPDGVVQYIEKRGLYREVPRRLGHESPRAASLDGSRDHQPTTTDPHAQEVPR